MLITSGKPGAAQIWHRPDLSHAERIRRYGSGTVELPPILIAGDYTTLAFQFVVGETALPAGGRVRIAWRWPIDWADLQAHDPHGDGYMRVALTMHAEAEASVTASFQQMGELNPWMHCIDLNVQSSALRQGDRLRVVCGDQTGGGRGWRAPTCRVTAAAFLLLINPDASERWLQVADPLSFAIHPGPAVRLVAVASAQGVVHEAVDLVVRAEDRWGNATPLIYGPPHLDLLASAQSPVGGSFAIAQVIKRESPAVYNYLLNFAQPGVYQLAVSIPDTDLVANSNPIHVQAERPALQLFWGDLHSGQTELGCSAGTLPEHYAYARYVAGLQFVTHQANDHYITLADWQHTREQALAFDEPGRFAVFLGCEWSPPTIDGGDRNVIYRRDEPRLRRSGRFFSEIDPDPEPDIRTAPAFHAAFQDEAIMVNMHVGGRPTNLDYHLPKLEPLAEIHSTHGTSEWFVEDALRRGYKVGITAGTDGVAGRPGADQPGWRLNRNVRNGLTAVYSSALTKEALWEAFQARRCYATNGARIHLWVTVDGQPMAATYSTAGHPEIKVAVEGTRAIERIDLLRGTAQLSSWQLAAYEEDWLRVLWTGARSKGSAGAQHLVWDGALHVAGSHFLEVQPVGLQCSSDAVRIADKSTVTWESATAGNHAGFRFRLAVGQLSDAHFTFTSIPCSFGFYHNQVSIAPLVVDAGEVKCCVSVGPAPKQDGPRVVELTYRDTAPLPGEVPYWVRVIQVDQGRAWSSPVYVTRQEAQSLKQTF